MSKTTYSIAQTNASTATFRAWGKALSDALEAMGFIKTADTGQIDWTAVNVPGVGTYAGYEIRRLSDTLQATTPVYAKIEYGTGSSATYPKMQITVGRAVDGAGNLVGITATAITFGGGIQSATNYDCYVSGGEGYIMFALYVTSTTTTHPQLFYLARPRDANGTLNAHGINVVGQTGGATFYHQWLPEVGSPIPYATASGPFCAGPKAGTGSYGSTVGVFPIFTNMGYAAHPDGIGIAVFAADIGAGGQVIPVSVFGASHDFISCGVGNTGFINGNTAASSLLLRWE
jgi:hypothetical protein